MSQVENTSNNKLLAKVKRLRTTIINLIEENCQTVPKCSLSSCKIVWDDNFDKVRQHVEDLGVFIYLADENDLRADKWSKSFRGFSIYYDTLPIICINDSQPPDMKVKSLQQLCLSLAEGVEGVVYPCPSIEEAPSTSVAHSCLRRYGHRYSFVIIQAYCEGRMSLHQVCKAFDMITASDALQLVKIVNKGDFDMNLEHGET